MSKGDDDGSASSEYNEKPPRFSNSRASLFSPVSTDSLNYIFPEFLRSLSLLKSMSQSQTISYENYEIIPTNDPVISTRPRCTIPTIALKNLIGFLTQKSSDSSESDRRPPKYSHLKKNICTVFLFHT